MNERMKKVLVIAVFLCALIQPLVAEHIKGGELIYEYQGNGTAANTSVYRLTLKLYIDCQATNPGQLDNEIALSIFDKGNGVMIQNPVAGLAGETYLRFDPASNPCIGNPPSDVCYRVRSYSVTVTLP